MNFAKRIVALALALVMIGALLAVPASAKGDTLAPATQNHVYVDAAGNQYPTTAECKYNASGKWLRMDLSYSLLTFYRPRSISAQNLMVVNNMPEVKMALNRLFYTGKVKGITMTDGAITAKYTFTVDEHSRVTKIKCTSQILADTSDTNRQVTVTKFEYDSRGNVTDIEQTVHKGPLTGILTYYSSYHYEYVLDRLVSCTMANTAGATAENDYVTVYVTDLAGRVVRARNTQGTLEYTYDADGRPTVLDNAAVEYNAKGCIAKATYTYADSKDYHIYEFNYKVV